MARLRRRLVGWTRLTSQREGATSLVAGRRNRRGPRPDQRLVLQSAGLERSSLQQVAIQVGADARTYPGPGWREDEQVQGKLCQSRGRHRKTWQRRSPTLHPPNNGPGRLPILLERRRDSGPRPTDRLERFLLRDSLHEPRQIHAQEVVNAKTGKIVPSRGQVASLKDRDTGQRRYGAHGAARNSFGSSSTRRVRYRRPQPLVHSTRPSTILAGKDKPGQVGCLRGSPSRAQKLAGTRSTSNAVSHRDYLSRCVQNHRTFEALKHSHD